ncbi:hypothetical protein QTN47_17075 [Danxiaibacter flavus]|uniref:HK97 gp10 family phage protein n=1 Tax=Danxiaibacter flavus TaxID=3049108 RepID=A0ABV3ZI31_9BACT|nr:hypothetical protein QNM32_17085 [Chitinophagaceae bacterium DXS]
MSFYTSNVSEVLNAQLSKIDALQLDKVARAMAAAVLPEMKKRIHVEGKDSNGNQIGTYSNAYLRIREGNFKNSGRKSRGANKGQLKDAGTYSKGSNKGAGRTSYNRGADPKVILSLTRQMENDEVAVPIDERSYGIGFNNEHNYNKSQWNEATYDKKIWNLTEQEKELARNAAEEEANNQLKS